MLVDFFTYLGYENVKLIGDENQPKVILDDITSVNGFVKNKLYNFTNKQFGGEVVYTVNLRKLEDISLATIESILSTYERKKVYAIMSEEQLFYVRTEKFVPQFSVNEKRYFFTKFKPIFNRLRIGY
jgi:hypothetical protein